MLGSIQLAMKITSSAFRHSKNYSIMGERGQAYLNSTVIQQESYCPASISHRLRTDGLSEMGRQKTNAWPNHVSRGDVTYGQKSITTG